MKWRLYAAQIRSDRWALEVMGADGLLSSCCPCSAAACHPCMSSAHISAVRISPSRCRLRPHRSVSGGARYGDCSFGSTERSYMRSHISASAFHTARTCSCLPNALHSIHLRGVPFVHAQRFDLRDMGAERPVQRGAS